MTKLYKLSIILWDLINRYLLFMLSNLYWNNLLCLIQSLRHKNSFYWLNHKKYTTFSEFISYLKFSKETDFQKLAHYADKCIVKLKLMEFIPEKYIIPTLFELTDPEDLRNISIDKPIVLKLNTGSGKNFILNEGLNKSNLDAIIKSFNFSLKINEYIFSRELHYSKISPKILAEPIIANNPQDYKIFFFKGEEKVIQVDTDRFINHKRNFYDLEWNLLPITQVYDNDKNILPKPSKLDEMIKIGRKIVSKENFEFARIDFYEVQGVVYFGEITFFPEGGIGLFKNKQMDEIMFNLICK
jgi:hypothetical protein